MITLVAAPGEGEVTVASDETIGEKDPLLARLLAAATAGVPPAGLRVSELVGLRRQDVVLGVGAHVRCEGKGRKERCTPLRKQTAGVMRDWLRESPVDPAGPLFPNARGGPLSRDGVQYLLAKHAAVARQTCASLRGKRVSPHVLRHSTAMDLLQHGVDHSVIALWLGHESAETTQIYLAADLAMKEKAVAKTAPV